MQVGNRQLPYPVFNRNESLNCFSDGKFLFCHTSCLMTVDGESLVIKDVHYDSNSFLLSALLGANKIGIILIVECPDTVYRKHWELTPNPVDIKIPFSDIKGKVVVSAFAYAKERINGYSDNDFLPDYEGLSFDIEKNDLIAIDDGFTFNANHIEQSDDYVTSIITVSKKPTDDKIMTVVLKENKIDIELPPKEYDIYDTTKRYSQMRKIYFGILLVPALAEAFAKLREEAQSQGYQFYDDFSDEYSWSTSLASAYQKRVGKELTIEELASLDPVEAAQKILEQPTVVAVDEVYNFAFIGMGTQN